jgi:SHS2 domain-containing protein
MYELFEHTADLGLRVTAPTLNALFADAARGLFAMIVEDPDTIRPDGIETVTLAGTDREYLLFDWLKHLLCLVFAIFDVAVSDVGLTATVYGEPFTAGKHAPGREVKAITYHELKVEPTADGWQAEVIVDI